MAPIISVAAALQKHVAPCTVARRAVLRMLDRQASPSAVRAAASTLSTKADSEINRPVEDVVVVGAGIAGGWGVEYQAEVGWVGGEAPTLRRLVSSRT